MMARSMVFTIFCGLLVARRFFFLNFSNGIFFVHSGKGRAATRGVPVVQIEELFNAFAAKEKFEGDNQLECEECTKKAGNKVKVDGFRCNKICEAPPYLNVEIIRYEWVLDAVGRRKVQGKIEFPVDELDLAPYFCGKSAEEKEMEKILKDDGFPLGGGALAASVGGAASSSAVAASASVPKNSAQEQRKGGSADKGHDSQADSSVNYELVGMLLHHGASAGSGHYTAVLRVDTETYDLIPDPSNVDQGEDGAAAPQNGQDGQNQTEEEDIDKLR